MKTTRLLAFSLTVITVLMMATQVTGQERYNSRSVYSYLGVGQPHDIYSSQANAMGVGGVAISYRLDGNISNPALLGNTFFSLASGGFNVTNHNSRDNAGRSVSSHIGMNQYQIQIPLRREKIGMSVAILPVTDMQFSSFVEGSKINQSDTLLFATLNKATGGLRKLEAGFGYRINNYISVGYAASLYMGTTLLQSETQFANTGFNGVNTTLRTSYRGFGNRFGALVSTPRLFGQEDMLRLGATATLPVNIGGRQELVSLINNREEDIRSTDEFGSGNARLPFEYAVGFSYMPSRIFTYVLEIKQQNWSDFRNASGSLDDFYKDRTRIGAGLEFAAPRLTAENLFTNVYYRAGVSYDTGHLSIESPVSGVRTDIRTLMFSLGFGFPAIAAGSGLDLNFDYGIRGTTSHEMVSERIFAIRVSFNISELMFLQRQLQ